MAMPDMGAMLGDAATEGEELSEPEAGPSDPFEVEAMAFLDEALPMPERMSALKEAIRLCVDGDYEDEKPKGGGDDLLIAAFGPPKKSKS